MEMKETAEYLKEVYAGDVKDWALAYRPSEARARGWLNGRATGLDREAYLQGIMAGFTMMAEELADGIQSHGLDYFSHWLSSPQK